MNATNSTNKVDFNDKLFLTVEGIIATPTVLGNFLLIYCIKRYKTLHTRSYILIANLAVSDLLFGLVFIPYDMTDGSWCSRNTRKQGNVPSRYALMSEFADASVFTLVVISLELYAAIVYPFWHLQLSSNWLIGPIASTWTLSSIIVVLPFIGWYD